MSSAVVQALPRHGEAAGDRTNILVRHYHRLGIGAVAAAALAVRRPGMPLTARPPVAGAAHS